MNGESKYSSVFFSDIELDDVASFDDLLDGHESLHGLGVGLGEIGPSAILTAHFAHGSLLDQLVGGGCGCQLALSPLQLGLLPLRRLLLLQHFLLRPLASLDLLRVRDDIVLQSGPVLRPLQLSLVLPLLYRVLRRQPLDSFDLVRVQVNLLQQDVVVLLHLDDQLVLCFDQLQLQLLPLLLMLLVQVIVLLLNRLLLLVLHSLLLVPLHFLSNLNQSNLYLQLPSKVQRLLHSLIQTH